MLFPSIQPLCPFENSTYSPDVFMRPMTRTFFPAAFSGARSFFVRMTQEQEKTRKAKRVSHAVGLLTISPSRSVLLVNSYFLSIWRNPEKKVSLRLPER